MKKKEEDFPVYDDDAAVKFIKNLIPQEFKTSINDEKIEYVLDVIYEFYDEQGFIEEDSAEEASIDEEEMNDFILKCAKKDKIDISEAEVELILDGEFEYGKSIGVYNEE